MDRSAIKPPRLNRQTSAVLVVDMQERLVPAMAGHEELLARASRLIQGANLLGVPVLATEQYPKGLGGTVATISEHLGEAVCVEPKTRFSALIEPVRDHLDRLEIQSVVVVGIEAHICVLGTCLDLLEAEYAVFPAWDAIGSRALADLVTARERLTQASAVPTTVESVLFEWLGDASDRSFKAVQGLIRDLP